MQAVELLDKDHSPRVIVDVLRTASKACVVKGLFQKAKLLIQEAVLLAKEVYGSECHPKYADCLMDLGFYLQNSDGASASVQAYEKALAVSQIYHLAFLSGLLLSFIYFSSVFFKNLETVEC